MVTLYSGVVSVNSDGKSAALVLKTSVPTTIVGGVTQQKSTGAVTASLRTADGATVSLTGTFTKATGSMTVQGGGYQFTATAKADGSVTGAGTFGGSAGLVALSSPGSPLSVSAATVTSTVSVQPYCGTYNGFYTNNVGPGNPEGGSFCLTVSGTSVWGSAPASGTVALGESAVLYFSGTTSGSQIRASCTNCTATITGQFGAGSANGNYVSSDANGGSSGTWSSKALPEPNPPIDPPVDTLGGS